MRWGFVPWWWSKPLEELRMATFNARAETVTTKPVFRDAFKRSRCLIPVSGYYEWQDTPGWRRRPQHQEETFRRMTDGQRQCRFV
jgi:putative SOS response-associated peptidase YedK